MGLFNFTVGFAAGTYFGLYISKNYNVPAVPAPNEIVDYLKKLSEDYKKDKPDKWFEMVRFKKRYFVVQFDREKDLYDPISKKQPFKPRALQDPRPLDIPDGVLALAVKDIVEHLHGDFGRAAVTTGLRTVWSNPETHLALIQCRHGPHRLVGSSLPFLTNINNEKLVPRLVYTGATIKNCFKVLYCLDQFCVSKYLSQIICDFFNLENGNVSEETIGSSFTRIERYQ